MAYLSENISMKTMLGNTQNIESSTNNRIYEAINSLVEEINRSNFISIDMGGLNIEGNITKDVLPDIERMLKKQKEEIIIL